MKILYLGKQNPGFIDEFLVKERIDYLAKDESAGREELLIVYEPSEDVFSIQRDDDLDGIREATKEQFWEYVETKKVPIIVTHRGGGMMWHGPGQICLAPLINIKDRRIGILDYSRILEDTLIQTLLKFGIKAIKHHYRHGSQGAWVENKASGEKRKIAFFGAHDSRGVIIHGLALNVSCDLYPFSLIDPCNLPGALVTSMKDILSEDLGIQEVGKVLAETFVDLVNKKMA